MIYDFKCVNCFGTISVHAKIMENPQPKCPNCGGETRKVFSAPEIQFKGKGFYSTDK